MKSLPNPFVRRALHLTAVTVALTLLTACGAGGSSSDAPGSAAASGEPVRGGNLVIVEGATAPHINPYPQGLAGMATLQFNSLVYETLLTKDADGSVIAGASSLSESFTQPDPTTVVVKIRKGVKFHSGAEMTSEDVVYSFEHARDPKTGYTPGPSRLSSLDTVTSTDDETVTFKLNNPDSGFLPALASDQLPIVEKAWTEEHGGDLNANPNGTGPFKVADFVPNDIWRGEAFQDYWDPELPYLDSVEIKTMADVATRVAAVRTGEADIVEFPYDQRRLLDTLDAVTIAEPAPILVEPMFMSCTIKPLDDVRVRQAVMHAIDLREITEQVAPGVTLPLSYIVAPDFPKWGVPIGEEFPYAERDVDKAKSLLTEAGYPDGVAIDVEILNSPTFDYNRRTVELAAQQVVEAGITFNIIPVDLATGLGNLAQGTQMAGQMGLPVNDDPAAYWWDLSADTPSGCTDEHIQDLIAQEKGATDDATRADLIKQISVYAAEQAYRPILYARPARLTVIDDDVQGYTPVPEIRWTSVRETWITE